LRKALEEKGIEAGKKEIEASLRRKIGHYFFVLAKTGLIFCKTPKVFCGVG
jgi:hypothetical protein